MPGSIIEESNDLTGNLAAAVKPRAVYIRSLLSGCVMGSMFTLQDS